MFRPALKDWPAAHKTLAYACLTALAVLLLGFGLYLRPKQRVLEETRARVRQKTHDFNALRLPLDPEQHATQLRHAEYLLEGDDNLDEGGLRALNAKTIERATRELTGHIRNDYPDTLSFLYGATRLDYKDLLERIATEFAAAAPGMPQLDAFHLGLENAAEETSPSEQQPVWQMMAKLWIIQAILQKSTACGLTLAADADGSAKLSALPVVGYTLENRQDGPLFLLEIPVKATFVGSLKQFGKFTESLLNAESFLPMKRLEVRTLPPDGLLAGDENTVDSCRFTVFISAYMLPADKEELPEPLPEVQETQQPILPEEIEE